MYSTIKETTNKNDCQLCGDYRWLDKKYPFICKDCIEYSTLFPESTLNSFYSHVTHYFYNLKFIEESIINSIRHECELGGLLDKKEMRKILKNVNEAKQSFETCDTYCNKNLQVARAELSIYELSKTIAETGTLTRKEVMEIFKISTTMIGKYNKASNNIGKREFNLTDIKCMIAYNIENRRYW